VTIQDAGLAAGICTAATYAAALDSVAIVATTDTAGTIIYANQEFERISKYSSHELLGQNHRILNSGHHPRSFFTEMYRTVAQGKTWRGEIKNRAKDGSSYWVDTWIIPANDIRGKVIGYISIRTDITSRKTAEEHANALNVELRNQYATISYMAQHDALTGLPNLPGVAESLWTCVPGQAVHVLFIDIDNFKEINDTLGHKIGDDLLKKIAERLLGCTPSGDSLFRYGGDEFVIVLKSDGSSGDGNKVAENILRSMRNPFSLETGELQAGVSIGIAESAPGEADANKLLTNADLAVRAAKSDGRRCHRTFVPAMEIRLRERRQLERDLVQACANGEMQLEYQPIVDTQRRQVVGCEALVRWQHPVRGRMLPAEFIFVAEETGLIRQLGEWVLSRACADAVRWPEHIRVAVNVSAPQFRAGDLVESVRNALRESGLRASRLDIEVTESLFLDQSKATLSVLQELRSMGLGIALDDFGTGYSSLSYLRRLPLDKLKIDRTFVEELATSGEAISVLEAIVNLANKLGMVTVVEGIETWEQAKIVSQLGCTQMQGFLFGRPEPPGAIEKLGELPCGPKG
jgi:diguanylate cyclase (GGDEF)-like protein/PAS domain S-box-containing protein